MCGHAPVRTTQVYARVGREANPVSYTHLDVYKRQHTHTLTRTIFYIFPGELIYFPFNFALFES